MKNCLRTLCIRDCECDVSVLVSCITNLQALKNLSLKNVTVHEDSVSRLMAALSPQLTDLWIELSIHMHDFRFRCADVITLLKRPNMQKIFLSHQIDYNDDELKEMVSLLEQHSSLRQVRLAIKLNHLLDDEYWSMNVLRFNADMHWDSEHVARREDYDAYRFLNHRNVCIRARITRMIETLLAVRKFRKSFLNLLLNDLVKMIPKCIRATSFDPNAWWDGNSELFASKKIKLN